MNWRGHVACNFNCPEVTGSHAHSKIGKILETVQGRDAVTTNQ